MSIIIFVVVLFLILKCIKVKPSKGSTEYRWTNQPRFGGKLQKKKGGKWIDV